MTTSSIARLELYMMVKDAELIRRLMQAKRPAISARSMAAQVGWESHSYMNRILNGQVRSVSPDAAMKIAYLLGVPVDLLFVAKASSETRQIAQKKSA